MCQLLKYLQHTINHGIHFNGTTNRNIKCYAYADYVESSDQKSTSGTFSVIFGSPVSFSSRKQNTVTHSTCKAKYVAANVALKEALRLERMFEHATGEVTLAPIQLNPDNKSAIDIGNNCGNYAA